MGIRSAFYDSVPNGSKMSCGDCFSAHLSPGPKSGKPISLNWDAGDSFQVLSVIRQLFVALLNYAPSEPGPEIKKMQSFCDAAKARDTAFNCLLTRALPVVSLLCPKELWHV